MTKDEEKTKEQLIEELREQVAALKASDNKNGQTEEASDSHELYKAFMDEAPYSFILFDSELNYLEINRHSLQYLPSGMELTDIIGRNLADIVPSVKESGRFDKYMELIRTGKQFLFTDIITYPALGQRTFIIKAFKVANGMGHIGVDITERKKAEDERDGVIKELEKALSKIKTLSGIIPICAGCKKIRDDEGYWKQVEVYVRDHTEAEFSHGLCPDCVAEIEKEIDEIE